MNDVKIFTGCPLERWEEVQAAQHEPFIYIQHNGSHFAGAGPDGIEKLLQMLRDYRLDSWWEEVGVATVDPCAGVQNPDWNYASGPEVARWINGERLYDCDGVVSYSGNFARYSHGFCIQTNHKPTIDALNEAIENNKNAKG